MEGSRKLVFAINQSIDGCVDHTRSSGSDAVFQYAIRLMREADWHVFGRKTYDLMVPGWPDIAGNGTGDTPAMNEFARVFDTLPLLLCSRTRTSVAHPQTTILRGDLADTIRKLKQTPGKNLLTGGVELPRQLIRLGLVDEYHFIIHPVVAGPGRRLFDDGDTLPELVLAETTPFPSGHVALKYVNKN